MQTRSRDDTIVRRRQCDDCHAKFQTSERIGELTLRVRKVDGSIVPFKGQTVRKSVRRAAVQPGLLDRNSQFDEAVASEARRAAENGVVDSQEIGRIVLDQLRRIDRASHVRFALVLLGRRDRADHAGWDTGTDVSDWIFERYSEMKHHRRSAHPVGPGGVRAVDAEGRQKGDVALDEVVKRDGRREGFDLMKLEKSIGRAAKGRGPTDKDVRALASEVAVQVIDELRTQPLVTSGQIAAEILRILRKRDNIAYLRYASTAKRYIGPEDYIAEISTLPPTPRRASITRLTDASKAAESNISQSDERAGR